MGLIIAGLATGLIMARLWWGCVVSTTTDEEVHSADSFVRGQIHYLSMDAGMSKCWNDTVKKLFHLACPTVLNNNPELDVELAFILTTCFCLSIGAPSLTCRSSSPREAEDYYHFSLIECATSKCFNKYEEDGFAINHRRVRDVCHYLLDKPPRPVDLPEKIPYIVDKELQTLKKIVGGDSYQEYRVRLTELLGIVEHEIQQRQEGILFWINGQLDQFWLLADDLMFKLRLGKYFRIPYY